MLKGITTVPGDKSITHHALILAALAEGTSEIYNPLSSLDCLSTVNCLRALGVEIEEHPEKMVVHGVGLQGLQPPKEVLDCGNSGTTMRLLAGVLAAQPFLSVLSGDDSLTARPMGRVVEPLPRDGGTHQGADGRPVCPLGCPGRLPQRHYIRTPCGQCPSEVGPPSRGTDCPRRGTTHRQD